MAWSTAELAELAGTSLRAVRHYHAVGLLEVPERGANGWKRYRLAHLTRLRQIVRLRDLGLSLTEIEELDRGGSLATALERLDDHLQQSVDRLQRVRAEIAVLTRAEAANPALPARLADLDRAALSEADESILVLMSCLLDRAALDTYVEFLAAAYREPAIVAFDSLPADADETARVALLEGMLEPTRALRARFPRPRDLLARAAADPERALELFLSATEETINPAQADVLARLDAALAEPDTST